MLNITWAQTLQNLRTGDYENNWPSHQIIRTGNPNYLATYETTPNFGLPVWEGQKVGRLLINADCGMGDAIQFFRFCQWFQMYHLIGRCGDNWAGHATIMCPWELWSLFGGRGFRFVPPNETCLKFNAALDAIIHIMALPHVLKVKNSEIEGKPYLRTDWLFGIGLNSKDVFDRHQQLKNMKCTKIGLCLSGSPFNPRDGERSIPLVKAQCLFDLGVPILNFNKLEQDSRMIQIPMKDWNHTSAFLGVIDVLITVDTAVAHLAGAMGVKTYLLLKPNCDWRWGDSGNKTVWYDSVTILRGTDEELIEQARSLLLTN